MSGEIDLSQFHEVFFEESFEGLAEMESGLLELDLSNPNPETINTVFRAAHSIKGGSGTFGFLDVADFTHIMESILDDIRSTELEFTDASIQLLLESVDFLRHMLNECKADRTVKESETESFKQRLTEFQNKAESCSDTPARPSNNNADSQAAMETIAESPQLSPEVVGGTRIWNLEFITDQSLFKSGIDPYRLIRELTTLGDLSSNLDQTNLPEFAQIDPENCYLSWKMTLNNSIASEEDISEIFEWIEGDSKLLINEQLPDEATVEQDKTEAIVDTITTPDTPYTIPEVSSIRVNIDRVDLLVNLVGELVITQSILSRFKEGVSDKDLSEFARGIEQLEENARELQEHTMQIRMLPIDNVFQRMPRLVRDLSKTLEKEVQLVINGKSTEVDRTVLEKISDPLTHLVRNCLDHGIETPEERIINGKPSAGKVEISAFHEGGNIIIEVADDGRGLNREAIRNKAIERDLISEDDELTDAQIDQLIFTPGFSTALEVSDVSGRGVGMDVVKNNIEQINAVSYTHLTLPTIYSV